jgi:hypothetical protein
MLDDHGEAYAQTGAPLPRRFGLWAFANGVHLRRWVPAQTGAGSAWALSEQLAPLEPVRDQITVVSGTNLPFNPGRPHCAHHTLLVTGDRQAGTADANYTAARRSIDQIVADAIGAGSPLRSLEVEVTHAPSGEAGTAFHWWSHNGPNSPNVCLRSCRAVFDRLFAARPTPGTAGAGAADLALRLRRSVLDAVARDAADLGAQVGAQDRARLEQHLDGIRAIEAWLARAAAPAAPVPAACAPGAPPSDALTAGRGEYGPAVELVNKTMSELVALALACDITRVFTFQLVHPGSEVRVDSIVGGPNPGHHNLSHGPVDDPRLHKVVLHYMKELRVFVEALRAMPEGRGTLLGNCGIVAANDCAEGPSHGHRDYPILVIGGAGGLRAGLHHRSATGESTLRVLLTVARAAGAPLPDFGVGAARVTDSLGALGS